MCFREVFRFQTNKVWTVRFTEVHYGSLVRRHYTRILQHTHTHTMAFAIFIRFICSRIFVKYLNIECSRPSAPECLRQKQLFV